MQVYRGMDIGTAKASEAEQARVRHHMIDIADPSEDFSVARFQAEARVVIADIEARGQRALLVGGTGLYVQAVIDDLRFPGEDLELRERIDTAYSGDDGLAIAYASLIDLEPGNRRRIVRALEVIELTGRPFSSFGAGIGAGHAPVIDVRFAGLTLDAETLSARVDQRLDLMLDAGLVDEVRLLAARTGGWSRTARQAIGYKEIVEFLEGRLGSIEEAIEHVAVRSRQFGRRQRAWFRREARITWFDATDKSPPATEQVMAWWGS